MGVKTLRPESVPAIGLRDAVAGLGVLGEAGTICVTGVCLDSRLVRPGDLYVALPRLHSHGAGFTAQAVDRGAIGACECRGNPRLRCKPRPGYICWGWGPWRPCRRAGPPDWACCWPTIRR